MKSLRNFFRRIDKTKFLILCFIPFGAASYYFNGWIGFLSAVFGWCLGSVIYNWKESKQRFKNFFRTNTSLKVKTIIFAPIAAVGTYNYGWKGFLTVCAGWCVGELISRRFLK